MKEKTKSSDMPIGKLTRVKDYLPSPDELVVPEKTVKVTLRIEESSLDYFKKQATKKHTKYQKMIRKLLSIYVAKHSA
ncbi:MAG: hypothetical protein P9M13_07760 [Candidatus Ancaeobacter aquaticus]|nr:hypothetical protein [Candidatus Ancaeobacter aquaticus]